MFDFIDLVCGVGAECKGRLHRPVCFCPKGFDGNPHEHCDKVKTYSPAAQRIKFLLLDFCHLIFVAWFYFWDCLPHVVCSLNYDFDYNFLANFIDTGFPLIWWHFTTLVCLFL